MKSMIIFAVLAFLAVASAKLIGDLEAGLSEIGAGLGADFGKIGAELGAGVEGIEAGLSLSGHGNSIAGLGGRGGRY